MIQITLPVLQQKNNLSDDENSVFSLLKSYLSKGILRKKVLDREQNTLHYDLTSKNQDDLNFHLGFVLSIIIVFNTYYII